MGWADLIPAAVAGGTTLLGGLFGDDSFTGSPAQPGRKGALPSTPEGQQLLSALQEEVLRAQPVNFNFNGSSIPIMDPFLRQKARSARELLKGEVSGSPADGGILSGMARPLGAAAQTLKDVNSALVDGPKVDTSWEDILDWLPDRSSSAWGDWDLF